MTAPAATPKVQTAARRPRQNTPASLQPMTRKQPVQKRAEITVKTIIDAAHELHIKQGIDAVTTEHVAERAGVAIGTLYRYFPNRDAILIRIADKIMDAEVNETMHNLMYAYRHSLKQFMACVFERSLDVDRKLLGLGHDFYRQHARNISFAQHMGSKLSYQRTNADKTMDSILLDRSKDIKETDLILASFMLMRGMRSLVVTLVEQHPEMLDSPALAPMLTRIAMAIVAGK